MERSTRRQGPAGGTTVRLGVKPKSPRVAARPGHSLPNPTTTDDLCVLSPPNVKEPQIRAQAAWRHYARNHSNVAGAGEDTTQ